MNAIAQRLSESGLDDRRLLAGIVDLAVVAAGGLVVFLVAGALGGAAELTPGMVALIVAWALYYHFACESGAGQTVGKKLMNVRVVMADGRPAGMREIALRTLLRVVDGLGLGLIAMKLTGSRRQRLGDLAAGTIVTSAAPAVEDSTPAAGPAAPRTVAPAFEPVTPAPPAEPFEVEGPPELPPLGAEPGRDESPLGEREHSAPESPEPPPAGQPPTLGSSPLAGSLSVDEPPSQDEAELSPEHGPAGDQVMNVRPVETVSAIDLVMGEAEASGDSTLGEDDSPAAGGGSSARRDEPTAGGDEPGAGGDEPTARGDEPGAGGDDPAAGGEPPRPFEPA